MVTYMLVDPAKRQVRVEDFDDVRDAEAMMGLDHARVESSQLDLDHDILVDKESIMQPVHEARYFSIGRNLYAGNAVICNAKPANVQITPEAIHWMTAAEVADAIQMGDIEQPVLMVGGECEWWWGQPKP